MLWFKGLGFRVALLSCGVSRLVARVLDAKGFRARVLIGGIPKHSHCLASTRLLHFYLGAFPA